MELAISLADLPDAAAQLLAFAGSERVFLFYGDMGAGKTTFIKSVCYALGVTDRVSSPTFSIVNEYSYPGHILYHFDFYRLKSQTEALDLGYEDYFYSGNYCFIEWPEKIAGLLPDHGVKVTLEVSGEGQRKLKAVYL